MEQATLTCPQCGHQQIAEIPTHACMPAYICEQCQVKNSPKAGDCCVFCSYGDKQCVLQRSKTE